MSAPSMREFWDRRADEDPFYFVDNRQRYRHPDEQLFWARGERELDQLLGAVGAALRSSDDVVEIGCGIGRLTRALAERTGTVRAIDVSPRMLELARQQCAELRNVWWLLGDGVSLRCVQDASADAVISHVVFQHIPDPQLTLGYVREIGRVLRPQAWAAFQISTDPRVHKPRAGAQRLRIRARRMLTRGPRGQDDPAWLGSAVKLDDVRDAAERGGMTLERSAAEGTQMCCVLTRRTL